MNDEDGDDEENHVAYERQAGIDGVHCAPQQAGVVWRLRLPCIWPETRHRRAMENEEEDLREVRRTEKDGGRVDSNGQFGMLLAES